MRHCATGEVFAREQETASDKTAFGSGCKAATAMRTTRRVDGVDPEVSTPYTNVTTTSLQAFHAFSPGEEEHRMGAIFPRLRLSTRRRCGSIPFCYGLRPAGRHSETRVRPQSD
jgi:hypothetical protein